MRAAFDRKLAQVRLRCDLNVLLAAAGLALIAGGGIAAVGILLQRALVVQVIHAWTIYALAGAAAVATAALWLSRRPSREQVALLIDERTAFHERFSTALALSDRDDAFCRAATDEAREAAQRLNVKGRFPVRPSQRWLGALAAWAAVGGLALFMPNVDLLGYLKTKQDQQKQARQLLDAKKDVAGVTSRVKTTVQQLGDPLLATELATLGEVTDQAKPDEVRREAIRKLGDLAEKIKTTQAGRVDSARAMQEMLKKLRTTSDGLDPKLDRALARGDFQQAAERVKQLQRKLAGGELSEEQREALGRQLAALSRQLQELADADRQRREALEDAGLDEELAELSDEDLRKALKDQGLTAEQIDELLEKIASRCRACEGLEKLGEAMARCGRCAMEGELTEAELAELLDELDELDESQRRLAVVEGSLDEIEKAIALLGKCPGGGRGLFLPGDPRGKPNVGTGGPGQGYGRRPTDEGGKTGYKKTGVPNKPSDEAIVASWYFKGKQVKGEARRKATMVVQAAKDNAADAIHENRIPRKYEESVKKYFGELEDQDE